MLVKISLLESKVEPFWVGYSQIGRYPYVAIVTSDLILITSTIMLYDVIHVSLCYVFWPGLLEKLQFQGTTWAGTH